jgi:hypothetical protein
MLIEAEGERVCARIDDGGFTRDYGYGRGMVSVTPQDRAFIDAAWRALGP